MEEVLEGDDCYHSLLGKKKHYTQSNYELVEMTEAVCKARG